MLPRRVQAEVLDGLAATDPVAARARRDLQRVHGIMRTRSRLVHALRQITPAPARPLRVLELGAGDGSLLLGVAREISPWWADVELMLLDRVALVDDATVAAYQRNGWKARSLVVDVLDWARAASSSADDEAANWDVVIANLFLHHFDGEELRLILGAIAATANEVVAFEPRRGLRALAGSHLIGAIGANAVTRVDAVLSVHAGFQGRELTAQWPGTAGWSLHEESPGPFSHCFRASRKRPR